jgi:hypothetical protein
MAKWCCDWFDIMMEQISEKGYSIIAVRDGSYRSFYLQARPFEKNIAESITAIGSIDNILQCAKPIDIAGSLIPLVIAMNMPLTYCLRCGANLMEKIKQNREEFDEIASQLEQQ